MLAIPLAFIADQPKIRTLESSRRKTVLAMDDHIRLVFRLDDDDPVPDVDEDALWEYHYYLAV